MRLLEFYAVLTAEEKAALARSLGTSLAYVSQMAHGHRRAGAKILARIEQATGGAVKPCELRPDLYPDWRPPTDQPAEEEQAA